jgi:signal transduction histidine kinase
MSGMVDDLLAIAVATSGGRSLLKIASVSAGSLLERAADAVRPLFTRRGIELEIEAVGVLPEISVDSDRVLRVFANLLDNALKFTDRPGSVVLRAKADSARVQFSVANSGTALSAAERERMFQPFWQAGKEDRRGAGIGLSICRSIIEAHGGTIWAEPEPGKRVRICFALPLPGIGTVPAARQAADSDRRIETATEA